MLNWQGRPAPAGRGALGAAQRDPLHTREHGAASGAERAGRGWQPACHLGTQRALLAVALGTAGGCCLGSTHRPCSAVGAEIPRKTRMGYNRKRC